MTLQVIGAGFGRTGTTSLKAALEQLGFGKCHHMQEVGKSARQVDFWQRRVDGEPLDWDDVFDGYQSSCDWPSCTYWEELSQAYPSARIILSVRDEERWYDSVAGTIYPVSYLFPDWILSIIPPLRRRIRMVNACVWDSVFDGRFEDREHAIGVYRDHIACVKATAPPERLLVFEAKQGWEPLCEFLGVPTPEGAYPHLNDSAKIKLAIRVTKILGWVSLAALVAGGLALLL